MSDPDENDPLIREVRSHQARRAAWDHDGEASVGRRLAQIGVLGWIIVAPMLMVGLGLGGWFAWRWMGSA
jgi:ATP synthase protein I